MNLINKLITYLKEATLEMKKVSWPTKKQTKDYTLIVIAMSLGLAVFFAVLDYLFSLGLGKLI